MNSKKSNPYRIPSPAYIAFSGGRTSGYMLRRILDAYDGKLPEGIEVIFCNTGLEHSATLRFVESVSIHWDIPITWLEYRNFHKWEVVNYQTASRNGEPFTHLLESSNVLPNPRARSCTSQLKVRTSWRYIKSKGIDDFYKVVGLRADEPRRVSRMRGDISSETVLMPLAVDGVTKGDVDSFWISNNFDLELPHGSNSFGNCVGCFLKASYKIRSLMKETPASFEWWIQAEEMMEKKSRDFRGARFRIDRPSYSDLMSASNDELDLFLEEEDTLDCSCTE